MEIDIEQMKKLVGILESSSLTEISIEERDQRITLKKGNSGKIDQKSNLRKSEDIAGDIAKVHSGESGGMGKERQSAVEISNEAEEETKIPITSPIVGTFYRSSSPNDPPYVEDGETVKKGDTVCMIEAMKVMNEVKSELTGTIVEICVDEGTSVEYGEELFIVDPDGQSQ